MVLGEICLERLFGSPFVVVGLGFSRLLARFDRAKRLTLYALLIEGHRLLLRSSLSVRSLFDAKQLTHSCFGVAKLRLGSSN
jgi:hypothetical protein